MWRDLLDAIRFLGSLAVSLLVGGMGYALSPVAGVILFFICVVWLNRPAPTPSVAPSLGTMNDTGDVNEVSDISPWTGGLTLKDSPESFYSKD